MRPHSNGRPVHVSIYFGPPGYMKYYTVALCHYVETRLRADIGQRREACLSKVLEHGVPNGQNGHCNPTTLPLCSLRGFTRARIVSNYPTWSSEDGFRARFCAFLEDIIPFQVTSRNPWE